MMSKSIIVAALVAYAEARFGQEQTPVSAVSALSNFGNPGEAATLAGGWWIIFPLSTCWPAPHRVVVRLLL